MIERDLIDSLINFYEQCSNRGWCHASYSKGGFITLRSSDTNFTHINPIFGRLPENCLVSPRLSSKNIKLLKKLITEFDRLRLITIVPGRLYYHVQITSEEGFIIKKFKIRRYTIAWKTLSKVSSLPFVRR